jgi:dnd system-associated protein 4
MIDRRIRIPKDKSEFIRQLLAADDGAGPFHLIVDVLAFASMLGAVKKNWVPLKEATKEPIRYDVLERQGYDTVVNLLAVFKTNDPGILADEDVKIDERATIFEGYANGGLEILHEKLKGSSDYLNEILLMIGERRKKDADVMPIDISTMFE